MAAAADVSRDLRYDSVYGAVSVRGITVEWRRRVSCEDPESVLDWT